MGCDRARWSDKPVKNPKRLFCKSAVKLSSWYEELKVANSAFYNVGWQRRAGQGYQRCHCAYCHLRLR
jgi:hypothetical protein